MNYLKNIAALFLILLFSISLSGQDTTQPESPTLEYVSVNPSTGVASLIWSPSPSDDVVRYVIYTYNNNTAVAIDTVNDNSATSYNDTGSQARYKSVAYVVAAMDAADNISPLSNYLSTTFLQTETDTCANKIYLIWTDCINDRHQATGYIIYYSVDGSEFSATETTDISVTTFTLDGYITDKTYCFYLDAVGDEGTVSTSNRSCTLTGSQKSPEWTEIEAVRVTPDGIAVEGVYDINSEIEDFILEKKSTEEGTWQEVSIVRGSEGFVSFLDQEADTTRISLYQISAVNNCGTKLSYSEPVRNIVLHASQVETKVNLKWNNPFPGETAIFKVIRDIGNGYDELATEISDTIWNDDYRYYAYDVVSSEITYRIVAMRHEGQAGTASLSSAAKIQLLENIITANAFTPNGDGKNDLFRPYLTFTPISYEFMILNRLGVLLFKSDTPEEGWNGNYKGKLQPPGTYLWTLVVKTPSGETQKRSGTVTLLP